MRSIGSMRTRFKVLLLQLTSQVKNLFSLTVSLLIICKELHYNLEEKPIMVRFEQKILKSMEKKLILLMIVLMLTASVLTKMDSHLLDSIQEAKESGWTIQINSHSLSHNIHLHGMVESTLRMLRSTTLNHQLLSVELPKLYSRTMSLPQTSFQSIILLILISMKLPMMLWSHSYRTHLPSSVFQTVETLLVLEHRTL